MTGMKVTRAMISCRVPSNKPTTEAAKVAVIKFKMVQGSRILTERETGVKTRSSLRQSRHLVHVFGGLFVDNVDDVVNCNNPSSRPDSSTMGKASNSYFDTKRAASSRSIMTLALIGSAIIMSPSRRFGGATTKFRKGTTPTSLPASSAT